MPTSTGAGGEDEFGFGEEPPATTKVKRQDSSLSALPVSQKQAASQFEESAATKKLLKRLADKGLDDIDLLRRFTKEPNPNVFLNQILTDAGFKEPQERLKLIQVIRAKTNWPGAMSKWNTESGTIEAQAIEGMELLPKQLPPWYSKAIGKGASIGLFENEEMQLEDSMFMPIMHKFMAKHITEDAQTGEPQLIGTIIEQICGAQFDSSVSSRSGPPAPGEFHGNFEWRFNDVSATSKEIELRRRVPIPQFGQKSTYNCRLPLTTNMVFGLPPYEVYELTTLVEMSTNTKVSEDAMEPGVLKATQIRPNIMINAEDERELFIVRDGDELDRLDTYEMITPSPRVELEYDAKKEYAPKYKVTFYAQRPWGNAFVSTVLPLLLVAALTTLNVLSPEDNGPNLEVSVGLALTVVFVLPQLSPEGHDGINRWFGNELAILLIFLGIFLASMTHEDLAGEDAMVHYDGKKSNPRNIIYEYQAVTWAGIILVWSAMLIMVVNFFNFLQFRKRIIEGAKVTYPTIELEKKEKGVTLIENDEPVLEVVPATKENLEKGAKQPGAKRGYKTRLAFIRDSSFKFWNVYIEPKKGAPGKLDIDNIPLMKGANEASDALVAADVKLDAANGPDDEPMKAWTYSATKKNVTAFRGPNHVDAAK